MPPRKKSAKSSSNSAFSSAENTSQQNNKYQKFDEKSMKNVSEYSDAIARLTRIEKNMATVLERAEHHSTELEQHREEIAIFHNQTTILDHLAKTFDHFTQSVRFLTVFALIVTVFIGTGVYVAWQDYRNTPSSLSIIGRETSTSTGNENRDRETCDQMQQQAITKTKARVLDLAKQIGGREIINTEVLILSDCIKQFSYSASQNISQSSVQSSSETASNGNTNGDAEQNQLITTVQITAQYR